jgi:hypothetical protein
MMLEAKPEAQYESVNDNVLSHDYVVLCRIGIAIFK